MKTSIKYFLIPFICIILFQVSGCIDELNYNVGNVNGAVFDINGFPMEGITASIGDFPVTSSDNNGKLSLENMYKPYDLTASYYSVQTGYFIKIFNLHLDAPIINVPEYEGNSVSFQIKVIFPEFKENQRLLLKFVGDDSSLCQTVRLYAGDTVSSFNIYFKPGYSNTNGKLIYLLCTFDPETRYIKSYDAFACKNITLIQGTTTEVVFKEEDVTYNPDELFPNIIINYPPNTYPDYFYTYLHFENTDVKNDLKLDSYYPLYEYHVIIPVLPGLNYKIKTTSSYYAGGRINRKWAFTGFNEPINIVHELPLKITSPTAEQYYVNDSTLFEIEEDGSKGIYLFNIFYRSFEGYNDITIITEKTSIRISDMKLRGLNFYSGEHFSLYVEKYPNYNSTDEFASTSYLLDDRYDYIRVSEVRMFHIRR